MTGFGSAVAKDPALLAWMWADKLSLQVFPVMPGTVATVEYRLTAPTRYERGRYYVSYPRLAAASRTDDEVQQAAGLALAVPVVTVHPSWGDARTAIIVDGKRVGRDTPIVLVPPPRPAWYDELEVSPTASYVASTIVIPPSSHTSKTFTKATVSLELAHTYKSDLQVELLTPAGERIPVHEQSGGGDNDLRGTFSLVFPEKTTGAGTWRLVVSDHAALDTGTLDHWSITFGDGKDKTFAQSTDTPLFVPDAPESSNDGGVATIAIAAPPITTWQARLGRVVASDKHAFARLEIDVAPQLVETPKKAQVVFVLDASYSLGEAAVTAQIDMIRAYMTHVPDAEVEIVTYRRHAQRVFNRFVPASGLDDALAVARSRAAFALGNGSALDEGAQLATSLLAPRKGPRRIVLTTDELIRKTLAPNKALAAFAKLSPDTIVHVVVPQLDGDDRPHLARRDEAPLAPVATRHHGIYVDLFGLPAQTIKSLVPVVLELVRPTRIENVAVSGLQLAPETFPDGNLLREGDGLRIMLDTPNAPTSLTLSGMLWSDPLRKDVTVAGAFSIATAAFVFGADAHHDLSDAEQMKIAMFGKAVSPVTSYVAAEPGVRPSTIGFGEWDTLGMGSYGTIGHGSGTGVGRNIAPPDWSRLIDTEACVQKVHPTESWSVTLNVETSYDEVLDVSLPTPSPMASCLAETTWALRLDRAEFYQQTNAYTVELSGSAAR
ncbi:MAG TPA: proprotein convertase P-domain-containing protein, partial [Kofleriaceae bacterium]|nr:proprotein convertase P-domain-containing protein [Kofleriaceae bacterium]